MATPSAMVELGRPAPAFQLTDTEGHSVRLADFAGKPLLVAFLCNHCPYVKHIAPTFAKVARELQGKGFGVVGVNSNDASSYPDDSPEAMVAERKSRGYSFPYCFDATQEVARAYGAQCTPDLFLYDRNHKLAYRGQFDDSRPSLPMPVTGQSLLEAAEAVRAGRPVATQKPSVGCSIKWRAS
ncbi:MAG: thioredoxin family protein [Thermoplasmatota archaeon]